jgi:hypothetical protein
MKKKYLQGVHTFNVVHKDFQVTGAGTIMPPAEYRTTLTAFSKEHYLWTVEIYESTK